MLQVLRVRAVFRVIMYCECCEYSRCFGALFRIISLIASILRFHTVDTRST